MTTTWTTVRRGAARTLGEEEEEEEEEEEGRGRNRQAGGRGKGGPGRGRNLIAPPVVSCSRLRTARPPPDAPRPPTQRRRRAPRDGRGVSRSPPADRGSDRAPLGAHRATRQQ
uniref:Uncharacterized protein n=1 Tax=Human herpesvirus 1 TaxID=10298 RepID=A0A2Z4H9W6_HHV1|nr:hypothetical protein [Human alphaherpesvirus 1]